MRRFAAGVLFAALFASPAFAETIHIAGSTTVLPVVAMAAKAFRKNHPGLTLTISGGGSGVGIGSILQRSAQIGMASRALTKTEVQKLAGNADVIPIARDAVAVAVSKAVYVGGVHRLSLARIADIYRGKTRNWKALGGPDAPILVIDKEMSRGTRHVFAKAVLGNETARASGATIVAGSNNEERTLIAQSDKAIGMLSNAWLNDAVRAIAIGEAGHAILPTLEHVRNGSYPIRRTLNLLVPKNASPKTRAFVAFLLSVEGQRLVVQSGYLPVR
ncbi:MAG: hypothetical protein COA65_03065 [Rhodospirillaceae bacterium]|nr:MAG: hypothetical protein COA65_03065 [Rhodospirillaceae bacterium]